MWMAGKGNLLKKGDFMTNDFAEPKLKTSRLV